MRLFPVFDLFLLLFAGALAGAAPPCWNSLLVVKVLFFPRPLAPGRGCCLGINGHPEAVCVRQVVLSELDNDRSLASDSLTDVD